jgi:hypothetical protein
VHGFLKVTSLKNESLTSQEKAVLARKGNELFNNGDIEKAKRIFLTIGYTDGIVRIGDYYYNNKEPFEAFRMYKLAPAPEKVESLIRKMALTIQKWIHD